MTTVTSLFSPLTSTDRTASDTSTNLAEDFNNFLNLLTVQLQNQDPLEPLDTNQFTEQIVQMTQVEQTVAMNERLGSLIDVQETQRIQTAADFVGKQVDALGDTVQLDANGKAEMFYALQTPASSVLVEIVDTSVENRQLAAIRTLPATTETGVHRLAWDGLDSLGQPVDPNGVYQIRVTALNADGDALKTDVGFSGVVEELRHTDGALTLTVAGNAIDLDKIVAARTPTPQSEAAS